ncbi:MAG: hypothetical protein JKY82_05575 [Rhizobiaceae bacterium]|nr:hypothetical protein [Rhizobiaceae bacterium]
MSAPFLTSTELQKFNEYFSLNVFPDLIQKLRDPKFIEASINILGRIDAGEQLDLSEVSKAQGIPEWLIILNVEMRNSDRRIANAEQKLMREALGSANDFLEKCRATKH